MFNCATEAVASCPSIPVLLAVTSGSGRVFAADGPRFPAAPMGNSIEVTARLPAPARPTNQPFGLVQELEGCPSGHPHRADEQDRLPKLDTTSDSPSCITNQQPKPGAFALADTASRSFAAGFFRSRPSPPGSFSSGRPGGGG